MAQNESIWSKITRLFRNGPVVRHKIATSSKMYEPMGTARAYKKELSNLYVNSLASYGQYERLARYADYSEMEYQPEIAAALNIYADEVTSVDEKGHMLEIFSDNEDIRRTLETLFFEIINVEFHLYSWVRNLCKFGDFVLFVDASETNGILNLLPIPINEIEREEGYDENNPMAFRYRWLTQGNMILENWQIIHFRLLGNDNFLPYGSCLKGDTRIWTKDGIKEIKNITPGDIVKSFDIENNKIVDAQVLNQVCSGEKKCYEVRTKHNFIELSEEHKIAVYNEKTKNIEYKGIKNISVGDILMHNNGFDNEELYKIDKSLQVKKYDTNFDLISDKIISIKETNKEKVYDIHVDHKNHNFFANGILVHNSVLEPARRVWRQLILIEDAMLIYRIVRSPERRVFKIEVGSIKPEDIPTEMEQIKRRLDESKIVNSDTGRVDLRYNPLSVDQNYYLPQRDGKGSTIETLPGGQFPVRKDSKIPLLDGRIITIEDLAKEYDEGKENWVYSVQDENHGVVPGKVVWCGKNYTCDNIHRVWLDDGSYVDMAPEHPIVMRDGTKIRADQVKSGMSVMPFRTKLSNKKKDKLDKYVMVENPNTDSYDFVHRLVGESSVDGFNELNEYGKKRNTCHHIDFDKSNNRPDNLQWMGFWEHRSLHIKSLDNTLHSDETKTKVVESLQSDSHRKFCSDRVKDPYLGIEKRNHKISHVELLNEVDDVYCMTVVGPNGEHDRHNFALLGNGVERDNGVLDGIFVSNTGDIEDVQYIQSKLFAALQIPKAYLNYSEDIGCLRGDTKIKLLDGSEPSIKEMVERYNDNEEMWVFTQTECGEIIPNKVKNVWATKKVDKIYRIHLDNGKYVDATNNHKFMLRDGTYLRADELSENQSLMPFYDKISSKKDGDFADGYHKFYDNKEGKWFFTHRVVGEKCKIEQHRSSKGRKFDAINIEEYRKLANFSKTRKEFYKKIPVSRCCFENFLNRNNIVPKYWYREHIGNGNHKICKIEILNLKTPEWVYDIEVENIHNFALSCGVQVHNSKASLAQQDVRFSRTIQRIQKIVLSELNKIAIIHLFLLGKKDSELVNFQIKMANPSTIAEQQKLELWRMKLEIAGTAQEGMLDKETIWRDIFGFSEDKIDNLKDGMRLDKMFQLEIEGITPPEEAAPPPDTGAGPVGTGGTLPGEEELPTTLGGGDEMQTASYEPYAHDHELEDDLLLDSEEIEDDEDLEEKKNKGSEGNRAEVAVDKGKDLFATGENLYNHAFGTKKQTASDPYDKRYMSRFVHRPFSESKQNKYVDFLEKSRIKVESVEEDLKKIDSYLLEIKRK